MQTLLCTLDYRERQIPRRSVDARDLKAFEYIGMNETESTTIVGARGLLQKWVGRYSSLVNSEKQVLGEVGGAPGIPPHWSTEGVDEEIADP